VQIRQPQTVDGAITPFSEMVVSFFGVTGPSGVLPYHYTALLLRRIRDKDYSLRDFLDLFHHRAISLFYRAWVKYRLPIAYERSTLWGEKEDLITWALYCLAGFGTAGLRGKVDVDDEAFLYYSGHFAHYPRSASALEGMLGDYFALPIEILQLQGQWLHLTPAEQAAMPGGAHPRGLHNQLGANVVVGERVWDQQSKFRVRVGPLTYAEFQRFMPNGDRLRKLCQLARAFVGPEYDFDVQVVLRPDEVPGCQLEAKGGKGVQLAWTTWMRAKEFIYPVDDAVFSLASP
jgi:type VI secretion system protein ImpH